MSDEISKHTIIILVILTVVISFLGTWTVMHEINKIDVGQEEHNTIQPANTAGRASITILEAEQTGTATIDIKS